MDVEIWKDFPEELVEAVIARLPILTLLRFRWVCRKWNSLPESPHFQQLWSNSSPQKHPLFFAVGRVGNEDDADNIGALYDPSTKEWGYTKKVTPSFYCGASAGGLVCYYDHTSASFRVGNCLTQTWKEFPWSYLTGFDRRANGIIIGMVTLNQDDSQLSPRVGAYKIIWADDCGQYGVYDSTKDSTSSTSPPISTGRIPANIKLPRYGFERGTVSIDTVVYFLANDPGGIISYDVVSGAWEQFLIRSPPNVRCSSIAECGGRLLLVGKVRDEDTSFSVCVWELELAMLYWKEVDRMPTSWSSEFYNDGWPVCFRCLGNRRVLVMSISTGQRKWIVTYDVVNREWSKAPRFTIPRSYPWIKNGVAFFPSLSASP